MKKYTSGAFESTTYGIYKSAQDTITNFPAEIIGNGGNITAWTIYGNMTAVNACGEKTANLLSLNRTQSNVFTMDSDKWFVGAASTSTVSTIATVTVANNEVKVTTTAAGYGCMLFVPVSQSTTYTISFDTDKQASGTYFAYSFRDSEGNVLFQSGANTNHVTVTTYANTAYLNICLRFAPSDGEVTFSNIMIVEGETIPSSYIPYGYQIPVIIGSNTYPIYLSEPLRKTLDGSSLYDTISSSGTLTRRADSSGDALATPTTESITVPTLPTSGSAQTFTIDTTLKPSSVELTYTGWHTHSDKQYSGGAWT